MEQKFKMKSEVNGLPGKIPNEVKSKIFSYLNLNDKKAIRRVCPSWRRVVDQDLKFHAILNNKTKNWLVNWSNSPNTIFIHKLTVQNADFNFRTHHESFSKAEHHGLGIGVSESCVLDFFKYLNGSIRSLELWSLSLSSVLSSNIKRIQPFLKWPVLVRLEINVGCDRGIKLGSAEQHQKHLRIFVEFLQVSTFPALKCLSILLNIQSQWFPAHNKTALMAPYKELLVFIDKHRKSLRILELTIQSDFSPQFLNGQKISQSFSKLRLTDFFAQFDARNTLLFLHMSRGLKNLKNLRYFEYSPNPITLQLASVVTDVMRRQGPTLKTLVVHKLNYFDCSCFTSFENLTNLELILLEPHNVQNAANLRTLSRFSVVAFYGNYVDPAECCEKFISLIVDCMPHLKELEVLFHGRGFELTPNHLALFLSISTLTRLTMFEIEPFTVEAICEKTPGLKGCWLLKPCDFKYYHVDINQKMFAQHLLINALEI